jgi:hypothetical protein
MKRERAAHLPNHYILRDEETGRFAGMERIDRAQRQDIRQEAETKVSPGHGGQGDQRKNPHPYWTVEGVAGLTFGLGLLAIPAYTYYQET